MTDADSVFLLPARSFAAVIALEPLSRAELELLHRRQVVVIDISAIDPDVGQNVAAEALFRAAGLCLARDSKLMSNRTMGAEVESQDASWRILLLEHHANLRSTLVRLFRRESREHGLAVEVYEAAQLDEALALSQHTTFDVVVADVCLGSAHDRDGLAFIEHLRGDGFAGRAFVLTAMRDYAVEAAAAALGARYVPKENLNAADLISRVLDRTPLVPQEHPSSVRLKRVSREDVVSYLAQEPDGLHRVLARTRADVVRRVVAECAGNRTAAARRLLISRQQVQAILEDDE